MKIKLNINWFLGYMKVIERLTKNISKVDLISLKLLIYKLDM